MRINLTPQLTDKCLIVVKEGNTLILNGDRFDLSPMTEGSTLPGSAINSEWFAGDVEMIDGEINVTLLLPNPANYSQDQAFPQPLLNVPDGLVSLPKPLPAPALDEVYPS